MIHPTAVVYSGAQLDPTVEVGAYAVIDAQVTLGPGCRVGPFVHLTGVTTVGAGNVFHTGAVIGDAPQDLKYKDAPTRLRIGDGNIFREHVTVHRSNKLEEDTVIGAHGFYMAHAHIAHNCQLGDGVMMANGATLGGHVCVEDRAFISGNCLVHQFVRVGTLSMMQGGSAISKDLAPFTVAHENNNACGLNIVGLRRAGFSPAERLELKQLYRFLFREGRPLRAAATEALGLFTGAPAQRMLAFIVASKRGVVAHPATAHGESEEGE